MTPSQGFLIIGSILICASVVFALIPAIMKPDNTKQPPDPLFDAEAFLKVRRVWNRMATASLILAVMSYISAILFMIRW